MPLCFFKRHLRELREREREREREKRREHTRSKTRELRPDANIPHTHLRGKPLRQSSKRAKIIAEGLERPGGSEVRLRGAPAILGSLALHPWNCLERAKIIALSGLMYERAICVVRRFPHFRAFL